MTAAVPDPAAEARRFNEEAPWGPFPRSLGLELTSVAPDRVEGRLPVTEQFIAGTGVLWAPVILGLADALCAAGTGANLDFDGGEIFTTVELKANFMGTAGPGQTITGVATPVHRGRTTHVWDVTVTNESTGRTMTVFRCTQMVLRP
ncbi:MAG: PaaI family thioesterase [Acidimicrobiia bacterium]